MLIQRVKNIITAKNMTASRFADHIGVPRSTISHILSGRNNPSLELIQKILDHFPDIRTEWLVRGKGPMSTGLQSLFPDNLEETEGNEHSQPDPGPETGIKTSDSKDSSDNESGSGHGRFETTRRVAEQTGEAAEKKGNADQPLSVKQAVDRVLVFYRDGTFDNYVPR
ncbi:MAG: helix-turn-helix transcriptional regulator [Bacteroidales bacterium]